MEQHVKLIVILGIGAGAVCYALVLWLRLRRCATWASAEGTVVRSYKTVVRHNFQKVENVIVRYSYFAGCRYESETVKVGGFMHLRKRDQEALLIRYPVGRKVEVFYDPNNPQVACLERRGMDSILFIGGYGIVSLAIGVLWYLFG